MAVIARRRMPPPTSLTNRDCDGRRCMCATRMARRRSYACSPNTDVSLVGRLLAAQFPQWAERPIERVPRAGTDNALYRLGDDMVVRLPRRERTSGRLVKERHWLPRLAPLLPLAVPVPL